MFPNVPELKEGNSCLQRGVVTELEYLSPAQLGYPGKPLQGGWQPSFPSSKTVHCSWVGKNWSNPSGIEAPHGVSCPSTDGAGELLPDEVAMTQEDQLKARLAQVGESDCHLPLSSKGGKNFPRFSH